MTILDHCALYLYVLLYLELFKNIDRYKLWLGKSFYSPFLVFTIPDKWNLFAIFDSKSKVTRIFFGLKSRLFGVTSRPFEVFFNDFGKKEFSKNILHKSEKPCPFVPQIIEKSLLFVLLYLSEKRRFCLYLVSEFWSRNLISQWSFWSDRHRYPI